VTEILLKEKTVERQIESASIYKDLRTVLIKTETLTNAFVYIFEYATVSAERPNWMFVVRGILAHKKTLKFNP
jgi:hypothetical protein